MDMRTVEIHQKMSNISSCPPINFSCIEIDSDFEVRIGKAPIDIQFDSTDKNNVWLIVAYALDILLVFICAFFFRAHMLNRGRSQDSINSEGEERPPIPLIKIGNI